MKSKDLKQERMDARQKMANAIKDGNEEAFSDAFDQLCQVVGSAVRGEFEQRLEDMAQERDALVLGSRGVHQLTAAETKYYQKLGEAMASADPKQALANADLVMPETVLDKVFEDLKTNHPLLSKLNFIYTGGAVRMMLNENGYQCAAWGKLTAAIVEELTSGFKEIKTNLCKLSAFLPIAKDMLELGPQWLDRYVREVLYEAYANGLEVGFVAGTGKDEPIGMIRQIGTGSDLTEGITMEDGKFPEKEAVALEKINPTTIGALLAQLAVDSKGNARKVENVLFVVNPTDYFGKVMPATTVMAPDGTYRNDVMPYAMEIVQSPAVTKGKAVIGLGKRYAALAGSEKKGRIEFSDHYKFVEDERMYIIKGFANGMPSDNNAFLVVDISNLEALLWVMAQVTEAEAAEV